MKAKVVVLFLLLAALSAPLVADSVYTLRPSDPRAVYLEAQAFSVRGDGLADDTDALQSAINKVQETTSQGIVFIPAGRYRLSRTVYVWPGIRLIGFGKTRPVFLLAPGTPAFQNSPSYMIFFSGGRPRGFSNIGAEVSAAKSLPEDANPGTFYSAMSNIDIEIADGNPGAVAVRARYAQHCFLSHMDFRLGTALAGIHDGGNVAFDLHFHGGQYGIWTRKPSPGWQFTVLDSTFDGQSVAAIREHEAGLTLIRPQFANVPTAVSIDPHYADELWVKDARLENISGPAFLISNENNPRTEINFENVVCRNAPLFASFRESGRELKSPADSYVVGTFSHGFHLDDLGDPGSIRTLFETSTPSVLPAPMTSDLLALPSMDTWVNVRTLGAHGDAKSDDTRALRDAIAAHRVLYFPAGQYLLTGTLTLKPDTILIGLHPSTTRFLLADGTPAFQGVGAPVPVLETPSSGTNIVTGIGVYTNGINPRAVAIRWMAGEHSLLDDVRFLGGHGTIDPDASPAENSKVWSQIYNNTHSADSDIHRRWDSQYPSLWVTRGGGGTFLNLWTPSTFAQAGLLVSDTSTPGRIYQLSSEHHVRNEVIFDHAANWQVFALQTEEERGEGGFALPLEIRESANLLFANFHAYRVVSSFQPFPDAIRISGSSGLRFRNIHVYSDSKVSFDNSVFDTSTGARLRQREFAWLGVSGNPVSSAPKPPSRVIAEGASLEKLATGFYNISGGAVNPSGDFFFVDAKWQSIFRWSASAHALTKLRDAPLDPVNLAFDRSGDLLVISYAGRGTVYSFRPGLPADELTLLAAQPALPRPGLTPVVPVNFWRNENDFAQAIPIPRPFQFVSPDGSTFLPAGKDFVNGEMYYGSKIHDVLRAFGLAPVPVGRPFYVTDESEQKTYAATADDSGNIVSLRLFAERGGEGVADDEQGNVYIAAGDILVFDSAGALLETIEVPERPTQLVFGGSDSKTLFIAARTSLYALRTRFKGR